MIMYRYSDDNSSYFPVCFNIFIVKKVLLFLFFKKYSLSKAPTEGVRPLSKNKSQYMGVRYASESCHSDHRLRTLDSRIQSLD